MKLITCLKNIIKIERKKFKKMKKKIKFESKIVIDN